MYFALEKIRLKLKVFNAILNRFLIQQVCAGAVCLFSFFRDE